MIKDIEDRIEVATKTKLYHYGDGNVREDITADWIAEFKEPADAELFIHAVNDIQYLLSLVKKQKEALKYYAELYKNIDKNIEEGELITEWLRRQGAKAEEALQE